jgi:hypothetical protein
VNAGFGLRVGNDKRDGQRLLLLNFHQVNATVHTGLDLIGAKRLAGNYAQPAGGSTGPAGEKLRPNEAVIYALRAGSGA